MDSGCLGPASCLQVIQIVTHHDDLFWLDIPYRRQGEDAIRVGFWFGLLATQYGMVFEQGSHTDDFQRQAGIIAGVSSQYSQFTTSIYQLLLNGLHSRGRLGLVCQFYFNLVQLFLRDLCLLGR